MMIEPQQPETTAPPFQQKTSAYPSVVKPLPDDPFSNNPLKRNVITLLENQKDWFIYQ